MTGNDDFDFARREIMLRRIGHETLLQSGDSVSRVLPVKKIGENEYQISFENAFTFQPDSLVHTTKRLLANDPLASDYVVNVLNCGDSSVAYGYAISGNKKDDLIACLGRKQPKACYLINITFQSAETNTAKIGYLLGSLALLAVMGYILLRPAKPLSVLPEDQSAIPEDYLTGFQNPSTGKFTLGSMSFDAEARKLMINEKTMDLTKTETRLLRIFALTPNEAVERSRLQKEIWEDEGVIVGRSLDMFISKLRKKLEFDPNIKIVVIRGKGYKLEISA
ncbi:winged helix-turn-helix domain-containing protein [Rufibacter latericius]|nr:winged helix-turn-helix domain-containing protein [Rufibacter latericius]